MNSKLVSLLALVSLSWGAVSCAGDDVNDTTNTATETNGKLTSFTVSNPTGSRTSLNYNNGKFFWENGDKIWVLDDNNVWQRSSNAVTGTKVSSFVFQVPGNFSNNNYKVIHNMTSTTADKLFIASSQIRKEPNTTTPLENDFGVAEATPAGGNYKFHLKHKGAILVFAPYTTNRFLQGSKLTRIEIRSEDPICGTYTINPTTGALTNIPSSHPIYDTYIELETGDRYNHGAAYEFGFPLPTTAADVTANSTYVVIPPGVHNLRIRYWLKTPDGVEGHITRNYMNFDCKANNYYDLQPDLQPKNYDGSVYHYLWDAKKPYWFGYEWNKSGYTAGTDQATVQNTSGTAYPQNATDTDRWYNDNGTDISGSQNSLFDPTSANHIPNVNEMSWYMNFGSPLYNEEMFVYMGKVHAGGVWFKKMDKIKVDAATAIAAAGGDVKEVGIRLNFSTLQYVDLRTYTGNWMDYSVAYSNATFNGLHLTASQQADYFFVPAIGYYYNGTLREARKGYYWSSSTAPDSYGSGNRTQSYYLLFEGYGGSCNLTLGRSERRYYGYSAMPFK